MFSCSVAEELVCGAKREQWTSLVGQPSLWLAPSSERVSLTLSSGCAGTPADETALSFFFLSLSLSLFIFLFRIAPVAYGISQARSRIRAVACDNTGSLTH